VRDEFPGLGEGLLLFYPGQVTIVLGSIANFLFEKDAKGPDALEPDIITDLGYGKVLIRQPLTGLLHSFTCEVLVRSALIDTGKQPVKMVPRQTGFPGYAIQVDGLVKVLVHI